MKKNKTKSILACAVLAGLLAGLNTANAGSVMNITSLTLYKDQAGNKNASTIYFGNNTQWRLLSTDAPTATTEGAPAVLLLSDKVVENKSFDSSNNQWNTSAIRAYLSGLETGEGSDAKNYDALKNGSFAKKTFSKGEYNAIVNTEHEAGNKDLTVSTDKLFLLCKEDTTSSKYFSVVGLEPPTIVATDADGNPVSWWLRSPGEDNKACYINENGSLVETGITDELGLRPALNLDPSKILFLSAAAGDKSKSHVGVGTGFSLPTDYDGSMGWKMTLQNDNIAMPDGIKVTQSYTGNRTPDDLVVDERLPFDPIISDVPGSLPKANRNVLDLTDGLTATYTDDIKITYNNAPTDGTANYVSAILTDLDGNLLNYAKISNQNSEKNLPFDMSNLADGSYKMRIFAEQTNGDYMTDYASPLSEEFVIGKGRVTVYKGKLSDKYRYEQNKEFARNKYIAILGNDFNLSFDNAAYAVKVWVPEWQNATITGDEKGTTLLNVGYIPEFKNIDSCITLDKGATLTLENAFRVGSICNPGGDLINKGTLFAPDADTPIYFPSQTAGMFINNGTIMGGLEAVINKAHVVLDNHGTWYPVHNTRTFMEFSSGIQLGLYEEGKLDMNDIYWDGHSARPFKELRFQTGQLFGNPYNHDQGGTIVLNTDLANNTGDKIFFGGSSTFKGKVQIAYDPFFDTAEVGDTLTGGYQFLTIGSGSGRGTGGVFLTAVPTNWNRGGKTLVFTPLIADYGLHSAWNFTGFAEVSLGNPVDTASEPRKAIPNPPPMFEIKSFTSETTKAVSDTARSIGAAFVATTNNLQKRLGDLRNGAESDTGWVRFERNKDDFNNGRQLNISGNMCQVGYDFALKNDENASSYFGLSLEKYDGNQSFEIGSGDIESTSVGAYYTKIYDNGHYFDFICRYGRYESDTKTYDFTVSNPELTKLDYALNGVTLSGEYGHRWDLGKNGFYIEPQAEFIYGHLGSASKRTNTGYVADIDSSKYLITRCGIALGQKMKKFNYYLRTSYYHDFEGITKISYDDIPYEQDGPKNWWEVSLGGGWNISNSSYFYAEVNKLFQDINNSINFNMGFRFTF